MKSILNFVLIALFLVSTVNLAKLKISSTESLVSFSGYVKLAKTGGLVPKATLSKAEITFTNIDGKEFPAKITSDGTYSVTLPTGIYTRTLKLEGFETNTAKVCIRPNASSVQLKHTITITVAAPKKPEITLVTVRGFIKNATTNQVISSDSLRTGNAALTFKSKKSGVVYKAAFLPGGIYEVKVPVGIYERVIVMDKFAEMTQEINIRGATKESSASNIIFMSPAVRGYRLVLTWGALPKDLDAHIILPSGLEVNFDNKLSKSKQVSLDVDNTNGFGPETITLQDLDDGTYTFYVNRFSSEAPLSQSKARVQVFKYSKLIQEIRIPNVGGDELENWHVLQIVQTGKDSVLKLLNKLDAQPPTK